MERGLGTSSSTSLDRPTLFHRGVCECVSVLLQIPFWQGRRGAERPDREREKRAIPFLPAAKPTGQGTESVVLLLVVVVVGVTTFILLP